MTDTNIPGFSWPELRTPSAENSAPSGGPLGNDGRGVCTSPCQVHLDGHGCRCKPRYTYTVQIVGRSSGLVIGEALGVSYAKACDLVSAALHYGSTCIVCCALVAA